MSKTIPQQVSMNNLQELLSTLDKLFNSTGSCVVAVNIFNSYSQREDVSVQDYSIGIEQLFYRSYPGADPNQSIYFRPSVSYTINIYIIHTTIYKIHTYCMTKILMIFIWSGRELTGAYPAFAHRYTLNRWADVSWLHLTVGTMGCASQFPSPTFLFSHAVTSSNHVAQEKIIGWNQFLFY